MPNDFEYIKIYDVRGNFINKLDTRWDAKDMNGNKVSNGVYFAKLVTDNKNLLTKIILIR